MKRRNLVGSLSFFLALVASSSAMCQTSDTFQRFVRFHNSLDRTINPTQSVSYVGEPPAVLTGPAQPSPIIRHSDFWAQSIGVGVEVRF